MEREENDILESASRELEASIAEDIQQANTQDLGKSIVQAISEGVKSVLAKAGGPTSDLPADKDKRGSLTEAGADPAKSPKKSGKGYEDSSSYEARKGHDMDEDDSDDDKDDMPAFFKKKGKKKSMKKMKKSYADEEVDSEEEETDSDVDATEFLNEMGEAVQHLHKSVSSIEEGVAVFGELLAEMADTRRDKLLVNMAKGINLLITENKELKKSITRHETMMKSISTLPGMPKVVGAHFAAEEAAPTEGEGGSKITTADRDRLFQLAVAKKITTGEMQKAIRTGDLSVLEKVK